MSAIIDTDLRDVFYWKGITVQQYENVFKAGTDALLLGTWIPNLPIHPNKILDVGTGSGILALLMAHAFQQAVVTGIDFAPEAADAAAKNIARSYWQNRIDIQQRELIYFAQQGNKKFDLILSNPPFYTDHMLPTSPHLRSAKHATDLPGNWMKAMVSLLADDGVICLVLPGSVAFSWIREANAVQLYCQNRLDIYSFPEDKQAKRSLLMLGLKLQQPGYHQLVMFKTPQEHTAEYSDWLGNAENPRSGR